MVDIAMPTPPAGAESPTAMEQSTQTTSMPKSSAPKHAGIVSYDEDVEQRNSEYQLTWADVMSHGKYSNSTAYKSAHVLLLSWDNDGDDLKVENEVNALASVFKERFGYTVHPKQLKKHIRKSAQAQINMIVANWVYEYDAPRTLLIVYFAGHGRRGEGSRELHLHGKMAPNDYRANLDRVIWHRTEENLRDTQADVLEIFDCCYAGRIAMPPERGEEVEPRAFEYLAAAPANKRTPGPGDNSFTSALIWALETLLETENGRFTTNQLLNAIKKDAPGFSRKQEPVFSKPDTTGGQYIILSPLVQDSDEGHRRSSSSLTTKPELHDQQTILTLKFVFDKKPSKDDIIKLGDNLNVMSANEKLHLNRVMWGGMSTPLDPMVRNAASRFMALVRHKPSASSFLSPSIHQGEDSAVEDHSGDEVTRIEHHEVVDDVYEYKRKRTC